MPHRSGRVSSGVRMSWGWPVVSGTTLPEEVGEVGGQLWWSQRAGQPPGPLQAPENELLPCSGTDFFVVTLSPLNQTS